MDVPSVLLVTNDYPPRIGGIQRTLQALVSELPPERVSVFAPAGEGDEAFDASAPYAVHRQP
jgi:phosphatidyl-myo-inositol dimannoside synthase